MSGQIGDDKIEQVRDRTDIVELVSQYVDLKTSGRNRLGLCPFHAEKSPSFSVNAERQFYHCFGCGAGGDAFSFLMQSEGLSFPDAVRRLAGRAGIDLEERPLTPPERAHIEERERLYRINGLAADYFHANLMAHPQAVSARNYLKERGYGQKAAAEYRIGYALSGWSGLKDHLEQHQLAATEARILGLVREGSSGRGDYDMFRSRLMFPILDLAGRVVAFGGRVLDDGKPKYINSPESPIYHKGAVLFGLYQARQAIRVSGDVLVVEGYFDQLALNRAGFAQAVATCGTALTAEHAQQLKRYAQRVVLVFDQDRAGKQATFKAMTTLQQEGVAAAAVTLPAGDDPDSFLQRQGAEAFQVRLDRARPLMELYMEETLKEAGNGVELKVRAVEQVLGKIAALKSELEQDLYLKELSGHSGIEVARLQKKLDMIARQQRGRSRVQGSAAPISPPHPADEPGPQRSGGRQPQLPANSRKAVSRTEQTLLRLLLQSSAVRTAFIERGGVRLIHHPDVAAVMAEILQQATASGCDIESLLPGLTAPQREILSQARICDPAEFAETLDQVAGDCLRALEKQALKRRSDQLWRELIPAADEQGDVEAGDRYRAELSQLQSQIKGRPDWKM
ncbi:DNA primase [Pelovirga terrestris]|uniref:DNA primase n=1 Tax=Pelovirga terrestris TaxID=2771352 RepID=A0A8J6QSB6_9BACT|nr:DNA primase [Pelovirga terrestris]MBD1400630.1 DNA primase [Pelovirga terrestris]